MKQPTFLEGVAVALAVSLAGGVSYAALDAVFPGVPVLRLLIAGIGLAYVVYLLSRSPERVGRVTAGAAWLLVAGSALVHAPAPAALPVRAPGHPLADPLAVLLFQRCCLRCADLGLNGLGLSSAIWALTRTGSVLLGIWCFFLVQALFVVIPKSIRRKPGAGQAGHEEDRFQHAYRSAETAVRKLSSSH